MTSSLDWSGTPVTKVSYGDEAADEYVFTVGDSVFVLETVDAAMAQGAATASSTRRRRLRRGLGGCVVRDRTGTATPEQDERAARAGRPVRGPR